MSIRISIDRDLCDSQAMCATIAPEVFAIDGDDVMQVLIERPGEALLARVQAAANSCPKGAIVLGEE